MTTTSTRASRRRATITFPLSPELDKPYCIVIGSREVMCRHMPIYNNHRSNKSLATGNAWGTPIVLLYFSPFFKSKLNIEMDQLK